MVKAELTIELQNDKDLHIGLDLLKREDANDIEFQIANTIQESLLVIINAITETGAADLIKKEIIK